MPNYSASARPGRHYALLLCQQVCTLPGTSHGGMGWSSNRLIGWAGWQHVRFCGAVHTSSCAHGWVRGGRPPHAIRTRGGRLPPPHPTRRPQAPGPACWLPHDPAHQALNMWRSHYTRTSPVLLRPWNTRVHFLRSEVQPSTPNALPSGSRARMLAATGPALRRTSGNSEHGSTSISRCRLPENLAITQHRYLGLPRSTSAGKYDSTGAPGWLALPVPNR